MSVDLKFVELTADVLEFFFIKDVYTRMYMFVFLTEQYDASHYEKTHPHSILQVPTTQLANMSVDLKVELTADVLEMFFIKYVYTRIYMFVFLTEQYDASHYEKTHPHSILQVPTTQLAKMSIDPKFVELTADVLEILL